MKILENFGETRVEFVDKFKIINIWQILSTRHRKLTSLHANFASLDQKWRKTWKNSWKFWDILIKFSMENGLFFIISYKIFLGVLPLFPKCILLEDNTSFLQQYIRFRGGGVGAYPLDATGYENSILIEYRAVLCHNYWLITPSNYTMFNTIFRLSKNV